MNIFHIHFVLFQLDIQTLTFEIFVPIFTLQKSSSPFSQCGRSNSSSWCGCHARTMLPLPSYSPSWLQPRPMRVLTSTFLMTRAMTIVEYFWRNVTKTLATTMKGASKANLSGISSCPPLQMLTFFLLRRSWVWTSSENELLLLLLQGRNLGCHTAGNRTMKATGGWNI